MHSFLKTFFCGIAMGTVLFACDKTPQDNAKFPVDVTDPDVQKKTSKSDPPGYSSQQFRRNITFEYKVTETEQTSSGRWIPTGTSCVLFVFSDISERAVVLTAYQYEMVHCESKDEPTSVRTIQFRPDTGRVIMDRIVTKFFTDVGPMQDKNIFPLFYSSLGEKKIFRLLPSLLILDKPFSVFEIKDQKAYYLNSPGHPLHALALDWREVSSQKSISLPNPPHFFREPSMVNIRTSTLIVFFLIIILSGTLGYHFIEGAALFDAFYMTMISVTTVGYGEIFPLSTSGRIFTLVLIVGGLGVAFTFLSHFGLLLVKGELQQIFGRRRMESGIKKMRNHFIIAGYGRTGQVIARQLEKKKISFVIIDQNSESLIQLAQTKYPFLQGNVSDEETLILAGIERAKGFIAVVSHDADNAFAIMTAKQLNPKLLIISRAMDVQSIKKLKLAGAHKVINPYLLGGTRIAQAIVSPHAVDFVELIEDENTHEIEMADVEVQQESALDGITLSSERVRNVGIIVVGIRKPNGEFVFQPGGNTHILPHDHLVIIGPTLKVENFAKLAGEE